MSCTTRCMLETYCINCAMKRFENNHICQTSASYIHQDVFRMFHKILLQTAKAMLMPKHLYFRDVAEHRRRFRDGFLQSYLCLYSILTCLTWSAWPYVCMLAADIHRLDFVLKPV